MRQSRGTFVRRVASMRAAVSVAVVIVMGSVLLVARDGDDSGPGVWSYVAIAVIGVLALLILASVGMQLAGFDADAPQIAGHLARDPEQQRLLARWLERARWARFVGGLSGLVAWFLGTQLHGDVLLWGTGGIAAGAVLAEMHHIRRPRGPRVARLEVRTVGDYLMRQDAHRMIGVAIAAAIVGVGGLTSSDTLSATWWALGALAALGSAHLAQQRVATRSRPAVSDALRRADDLARELAIGRGLARPATFFALALLARACIALNPTIGWYAPALGAAAWIYGAYLWWHNRRLGLDFLLTEHREPSIA